MMSRTLHLLPLLVLAGIVRADASGAHNNVTDGPHSCGGVEVPYPFGVMDEDGHGDFRPGFHVTCEHGKAVHATGGAGIAIPIGDFSIKTAEARMSLPVSWQCYNSTGTVVDKRYLTLQMYNESVYRFSNTRNDLFVLGCFTLGYLRSKPHESDTNEINDTTYAQLTGCLSYCNDSKSAVSGLCSGVGCCHVGIPPDLVDNSVDFTNYEKTDKLRFSTCDYAFLVEKGNYTFNTTDFNMHLQQPPRLMPVMLDWAIRDSLTCKEAKTKKDYACKSSNSLCLNATNGPGYICNCSEGYEGNPYIPDGCTDINECERLDHDYRCKGECKNKQGDYECTCPKNTHSVDPYNEACREKFPHKIIIAMLGLFIIVTMTFWWLLIEERKKAREYFAKNGGPALAKLNNIRLFNKEDLRKIRKTNNVIGSGGFGKVYKGHIEDINQPVAVKEPIKGNSVDKDQFVNEISIQSRLIHKNIVKLIGCCLEVEVPILVYEFQCNGSLHDILHGSSKMPLNMGRRLQIAAGSAEGLAYMHSKTNTSILHGDVKPANILLNGEFIPKISDFGISRLIATDKQHTGHVIGDMKYMDPVFLQTGFLTNKSDVYSFGVVLLELITRKKASRSDNNSIIKNFLEAYAKDKYVIELVDKELGDVDREIIDNLARMIVQCLNLDVNERPEMIDVAELLRDMVKRYHSK